jgi:hypothetical protein
MATGDATINPSTSVVSVNGVSVAALTETPSSVRVFYFSSFSFFV